MTSTAGFSPDRSWLWELVQYSTILVFADVQQEQQRDRSIVIARSYESSIVTVYSTINSNYHYLPFQQQCEPTPARRLPFQQYSIKTPCGWKGWLDPLGTQGIIGDAIVIRYSKIRWRRDQYLILKAESLETRSILNRWRCNQYSILKGSCERKCQSDLPDT